MKSIKSKFSQLIGKNKDKQKQEDNSETIINAQEWLEKNYPDKEWVTRTIYLNQQLEGVLDCSEYKNLWHIFISSSIDSSKLEIRRASYKYWEEIKETNIISCLPAQTYLDQWYPTRKEREKITELNIIEKALEGTLDLSDFKNLEELNCYNNYLANLKVNNCKKLKEIKCWNNQLTTLNLSNLEELEELVCSNNYLTQIPCFPQSEKITELDIRDNHLSPSNLTIFSQFRNLEELYIGNHNKIKINQNIYNHFTGSLEPLKDLNNLRELNISNTDLNSGWEYLPDSLWNFVYDTELRPNCKLAQVKEQWDQEIWKDIHQDFSLPKYKKEWLDQGFSKEQTKEIFEEWSPAGVRPQDGAFINWFLNFKKLDLAWACENEEEFKYLRGKYIWFGTCQECQQPNTSKKWCHSCNAKHFEEGFNTWTSGNPQIDNFIQKCQLKATSPWNVLEWTPYKKFTEIEPIAKGGFGKVEKAEWKGGSIERWDYKKMGWRRSIDGLYKNYKTVALKTLFNSQDLNQDFLKELTLYKRFKSEVSQMVPCYGISRDGEGNYIMVMEYMKEGNLREYLRKNYRWLGLERKLHSLQQITQGLKDIHRKKLMHCDFHSGNIVVDEDDFNGEHICHITDLGLSKPVNEVKKEGKIYGLMPYMAPEVLSGEPYTQKSDIYSLGMIMYEILTCLPPYVEYAHDVDLALMIIQGVRPQFPKQVKYPQLLVDLIKQCWDSEPNNRPSAREISGIVGEWFDEHGYLKTDTKFYHQLQEAETYNRTLPEAIRFPNYELHPGAVYHSKPINTKQITNLLTSQGITLDLGSLSIQSPQEESSTQAQIEIPPKSRD